MKKETSCRALVNADGMRTVRTALMFMAMLMLASCANQTSGNEASIEEEAVVPSLSEDISDVVSIVDVRPIDESVLFAGVSKLLNAGQGNLFILDSRGAIISLNGDGQQGPLKLTRGRASNEYVSASDICYIDGKLCVLENARIKVFDIYDTHKNFQIDLTGLDDPADALAVVPGDRFYLFSAFSMSSRSDKKGRGYTLRMIDRDGHLISESIPREDCTFSMNNISQSGDNTYYLRPQNSESIFYRLEKDGPVPAFKVDFGDKAMPARYFYDAAGEDIGAYMLSDYYKLPMDYHETGDYIYIRFCGSQASECSMVYSRKSKKCIAWQNTREDSAFRILGSDKDGFILIPSNSDGDYGPLGRVVKPSLEKKCADGQSAIVRIKFSF